MQPTEVIWDNAAWRMTNVLVVDDEPNLVDLVKGYLEREGFEVSAASDGPTAVDVARAIRPDLVVLDLMLPGFDGLEVCRRLRQFTDAYVLMLTARGEEVDRIVGLEVGADDYLTKPFSPRELVARVKAMLRRPRGGRCCTAPRTRVGCRVTTTSTWSTCTWRICGTSSRMIRPIQHSSKRCVASAIASRVEKAKAAAGVR